MYEEDGTPVDTNEDRRAMVLMSERRAGLLKEYPQATERDLDIMIEREDSWANLPDHSVLLGEEEDESDDE